MENHNHDFVEYYDIIFSNKNYSEEIEFLYETYRLYRNKEPFYILDVGCGTGNHALEFARKKNVDITAIDIDEKMIDKAKEKDKDKNYSVNFFLADITQFKFDKKFDLIYSMFNVINYIHQIDYLEEFFKGIFKNLNPDGIYIFDCFNSISCTLDPPKTKLINIDNSYISITGTLVPDYDAFWNYAIYKYTLKLSNGKEIYNELKQTYWSPLVIKQMLNKVGFKKVDVFKYLENKNIATESDYKLSWVCCN